MTELTDRIASVSLTTILFLLTALTLLRGTLIATRLRPLRSTAELCESAILALTLVFLLLRPFVVQSFFIPSGSMHPTLWEGDRILVNKWAYRTQAPKQGDIIVFRSPLAAASDEKDYIKRVVGVPGDKIEVQAGCIFVGSGENPRRYTRDAIYSALCPEGRTGEEPTSDEESTDSPCLRLQSDGIWIGGKEFLPEQFAAAVGRPGEEVSIHPGRIVRNDEVLMESYVAEDPQYDMSPIIVPQGYLFVLGDNRNDSRDSHIWGTFPMDRVIGRADAVFWPPQHIKKIAP